MNKILLLFITLIFINGSLKAQSDPALTIGAGVGAATAYAGAKVIKTDIAYNGGIFYYPTPVFDVGFEAQVGKLAGGNPHTTHLNFINSYQAGFIEAHLHMSAFFDDPDNAFLSVITNFYAGTGFGLIHNRVTQINATIDYSRNIIPVIPVKIGYIFNVKNAYDESLFKINLAYSLNPTIGRGLDGYFGSMPQATKMYAYYSIGLEYTIGLVGVYKGRNVRY